MPRLLQEIYRISEKLDGKETLSSLLVPIAKASGDRSVICVLQLRNKQPKNVHDSKKQVRPAPGRSPD